MSQQNMNLQNMNLQDMNKLTNDLERFSYQTIDLITPEVLHVTLWPQLNRLRNSPNKNNLIASWKYKDYFIMTEENHTNGSQQFKLVNWEQSFVLSMWMCIHH